jgi:DNA-directed RNA polymerase
MNYQWRPTRERRSEGEKEMKSFSIYREEKRGEENCSKNLHDSNFVVGRMIAGAPGS